jgi:hypothetical protein
LAREELEQEVKGMTGCMNKYYEGLEVYKSKEMALPSPLIWNFVP